MVIQQDQLVQLDNAHKLCLHQQIAIVIVICKVANKIRLQVVVF